MILTNIIIYYFILKNYILFFKLLKLFHFIKIYIKEININYLINYQFYIFIIFHLMIILNMYTFI